MNGSSGETAPMLTPVAGATAPAAASPVGAPVHVLDDPGFSIGRFKVEAAGLVLLLVTLAAIVFQDLFTTSMLTLSPETISRYSPYWYDDKGNGGNSVINADPNRPLTWSCDLRPAYEFPFCGYGIAFDPSGGVAGIDLARFQRATVRLRYSGPGPTLRLNFKNQDRSDPKSDPVFGEITVPVTPGAQTIELDLAELALPFWWANQHHIAQDEKPPRNNITSIELAPGKGSTLGHYDFAVESVKLEGKSMSQAQFYLALLSFWAVLVASFLAYRVFAIRRKFESRHERQLREARELQFAHAVAERSSAAKSAFLANMSHELRTPLNAILGYAQLLEQGGLAERETAAARTIRQSGTHLLTLITDILDLSKIEAGRLELDPSPFDLHLCASGVADMVRIRASEKAIDFLFSIGPSVPRNVIGDEKRLRQVLINLLGNAIKFTSAGEVALRLTALGPCDDGTAVRIEVRDTGAGMRQDELAKIFEPFEQVGSAGARAGGTGLGLSISRRIVGLMGGAIHVESTEGQGSRFWFDLVFSSAAALAGPAEVPKLAASAAEPAAGEAALTPPCEERLQVLLQLARAGNMRAIRAFAEEMAEKDPELSPFAERLKTLAAGYQSPAILDLVSRHTAQRKAA